MKNAAVNGVELEYEVIGSGEPVLLISPVLADGFVPLVAEPSLAERYQLIRYHKRGWVGSTHTAGPVSVGRPRRRRCRAARPPGDRPSARRRPLQRSRGRRPARPRRPGTVATLALLELSLFSVPSGEAFLAAAAPVFDAYVSGEPEEALAMFLSAVSGLEWATCRGLLDERIPGAVAQAIKDADTFFGVELPGAHPVDFGAEQAAAIRQPVLSVLGSDTAPLWVEVAEFLRWSVPDVEERTIDGVGHLLHIQRPAPVAEAIADFLRRHPVT